MEEIVVTVKPPYITLAQLLKLTSVIGNGGEAKAFLAEASVLVNGESEARRGRKLREGDRVTVNGKTFLLEFR